MVISNEKQNTQLFNEKLETLKVDVIGSFKPTNIKVAKEEFLSNNHIRIPNNEYGNLNENNLIVLLKDFKELSQLIVKSDMNDFVKNININGINKKIEDISFLLTARKVLDNPLDIDIRKTYMTLNENLNGKPEENVYREMLSDTINSIEVNKLDEIGLKIYSELRDMVDKNLESGNTRFKPKDETVEAFGEYVNAMFGDLLQFVPENPDEGKKFSAVEIKDVFTKTIDYLKMTSDFNDAWAVKYTDSSAISVDGNEKKILIPKDRAPITKNKLKGLLVHEIGTHVYRLEMGEQTNILPLARGLNGYLDAEEGFAKAMEMAVSNKYEESGIIHYVNAGMAYFDNKDFRDVFEARWRISLLTKKKPDFSKESIEKAKDLAYNQTQRIFRGTNILPWFKDLSYYNGSTKIWKHIENNIDNPTLFDNFLLAGKIDPLNKEHERTAYELWTGKSTR